MTLSLSPSLPLSLSLSLFSTPPFPLHMTKLSSTARRAQTDALLVEGVQSQQEDDGYTWEGSFD
jgi:hypothetical protein